jgi:hypothetical protein
MASTRKARLVVGLFGTAQEFALGLAELGANGLVPAQISLIAQADAFEGTLARWWEAGGPRAFASWTVCRPVGGAVSWAIAPAGPGEAASSTAINDAQAVLGFDHWALRRHARQLHALLEQGGAVVLVEADTETEERAACMALLRYASLGVQTHEIARSQEG